MDRQNTEKLNKILDDIVQENLYRILISRPLDKGECSKITIRPVMVKGKLYFQETRQCGPKVLHDNFEKSKMCQKISEYMQGAFGQMEAECTDKKVTLLTNKRGTLTIKTKKTATLKENENICKINLEHNRTKNYILPESEPVDFLIELGVQQKNGNINKSRYDKFKQINRYLEFVEDILPVFGEQEFIRIIDFGCGKSYLTFALYYYLCKKKQYKIEIIGLDLKKDVIDTCNRLKDKLQYNGLTFLQGDIKDYEEQGKVDMVVSLHACDTATDYALHKAVEWGAKVIMAVPCCQHEVNKKMVSKELESALQYGIIREKMSALLTDAYRARCLEAVGYDTQMLEFIDMEHTPKNILVRAVKQEHKKQDRTTVKSMELLMGMQPLLGRLLEL